MGWIRNESLLVQSIHGVPIEGLPCLDVLCKVSHKTARTASSTFCGLSFIAASPRGSENDTPLCWFGINGRFSRGDLALWPNSRFLGDTAAFGTTKLELLTNGREQFSRPRGGAPGSPATTLLTCIYESAIVYI
jgi:hypothetical protein